MNSKSVSGFSKLNKSQKIEWLAQNYLVESDDEQSAFETYWLPDHNVQKVIDGFSENTISN